MKKKAIAIIISLLTVSSFVFSSEMKVPAGVQVSAMGGAGTSLVREESVYYNSAALAFFKIPSVVTSWQRWYDFIDKGQIIGILPCFKNMTVGIFDSYSTTEKIDCWDEDNNRIDSSRFSSNLVSMSAGWRLINNLSVGGSIKYLTENTDNEEVSSDVAGDLAVFSQYKKMINMGVNWQNIGDKQESVVKVGVSILDESGKLSPFPTVFSLDLNYPLQFKSYLSFGIETFLYSILYVRLGYRTGPLDLERLGYLNGLSLGFGVKPVQESNWQLDYSFVPNGDLGEMHKVGLGYKFGKKLKPAEEDKEYLSLQEDKLVGEGEIKAEVVFQEGIQLAQQKNYLEAILAFKKCLKQNSDYQEAKDMLKEITAKLDKEINLEGQDSMIFQSVKKYYIKGIGEYKRGNFEGAIVEFNKVLKQTFHPKTGKYLKQAKQHLSIIENRKQAKLYFQQAENSIQEGRYSQAKEKLEKSLLCYPEYLSAKELLEQVLLKTEGEQKIKKHLSRGRKNFNKKEYEKALINFYHVLRLNPENKESLQMVRKCGLKIIKTDKVEELSEKARKDCFEKGKILEKKGEYQRAVYQWAKIIINQPTDIEVLKEIKRVHYKAQKNKKEEQLVLKQEKEKIKDYNKKAEEFYKKGEYNFAIEYWQKVLDLAPENKQAKEGIKKSGEKMERMAGNGVNMKVVEEYYKQGLIYYNQGKYREAIFEWKRVLDLVPDHEKAKANIKAVEEKMQVDR
ncbi:tetratricopeptide repeat protein [bacterium]|nr:tetratricopeptide repeat protein [bacterium]